MNPPRRPEEARTRKNATFPPDIKGKTLHCVASSQSWYFVMYFDKFHRPGGQFQNSEGFLAAFLACNSEHPSKNLSQQETRQSNRIGPQRADSADTVQRNWQLEFLNENIKILHDWGDGLNRRFHTSTFAKWNDLTRFNLKRSCGSNPSYFLPCLRSATYNRRTGDCTLSDLDRRTAFGSTGSFIVSCFLHYNATLTTFH